MITHFSLLMIQSIGNIVRLVRIIGFFFFFLIKWQSTSNFFIFIFLFCFSCVQKRMFLTQCLQKLFKECSFWMLSVRLLVIFQCHVGNCVLDKNKSMNNYIRKTTTLLSRWLTFRFLDHRSIRINLNEYENLATLIQNTTVENTNIIHTIIIEISKNNRSSNS